MDNTLVWADIPTKDLDRAMAFYSALLDVPVTPIQEEIRFAMLRHDGNNAAACLGPMDKYHQPGHTGPSSTSPLASACRRLNSWCPRSADGCSNPCTASAAAMAPESSSKIPRATGWPSTRLPPADDRWLCQKQQRRPHGRRCALATLPGHQTCGLRRVGMPVRCSSTCLTTLESLSMWAMKRVVAWVMGSGTEAVELNSSSLRDSGSCTSM